MSYHTWNTYGFGICVDDIYRESLSVYKIRKLASTVKVIGEIVDDYIDDFCLEQGIKKEEFTIDDFDGLEGDYCERGLTYILFHVIKEEIPVVFADDYDCVPYILYCPDYPWNLEDKEKNFTEVDVVNIFNKYVKILTDVPVKVDYYNVENGG